MREIDNKSLKIYSSVVREYEKNLHIYGPYMNIFGIFMHEIMLHLTNFMITRESSFLYDDEVDFPYVNTKYTESPFLVSMKSINASSESNSIVRSIKINALTYFLRFFSFGKVLSYSESTDKAGMMYLLKNAFKYKACKISNIKCNLPNRDAQVNELSNFLYNFCYDYSINNKEIFVNNFISYIEQFLTNIDLIHNNSTYISGSSSIIQNRIISAHCLENKLSVVSFAHGNHDMLVFDDPYAGYADMSYVTHYITYGSFPLGFGKYNNPLKRHDPLIYRRSCFTKKNYIPTKVVNQPNKRGYGLYVPTVFSANTRYGPFRDLDDDEYYSWQMAVFKCNNKLYYKDYPSNRDNGRYDTSQFLRDKYARENLNNVNLDKYSYVVLDYISTSFAISAVSPLPILYFNLGLMNISEKVIGDVKSRVFWVDIDLTKNIKVQITRGFIDFFNSNREYSVEYGNKYSLSNNSVDKVLSNILSMINNT